MYKHFLRPFVGASVMLNSLHDKAAHVTNGNFSGVPGTLVQPQSVKDGGDIPVSSS